MSDWEPVDWNGDDASHFLQGCVIAALLSAPLWAMVAALLGWLS